MAYNEERLDQLFNKVNSFQPVSDTEKNKKSLYEACLLAEAKDKSAYLLKNCSTIDEFGEVYFGKKHTQTTLYIRVATSFGQKQADGEIIIPNFDSVARYSVTQLDEIRKFPGFHGDLEEIEKKYNISPADSKKTINKILKKAQADLLPNINVIREQSALYETIEIDINKDLLNDFKLAAANEGSHYLHVIKELIKEYTKQHL